MPKFADRALASPPARKSKSTPRPPAHGYLAWSRDPAIGIFAVLPLWLAYEVLRLMLAPEERNGAEALVTDTLGSFGPQALIVLRAVLGVAIGIAAWSIVHRRLPWARIALVSTLEGAVYGLMLGPITGALTVFLLDSGEVWLASGGTIAPDLVASLGAGIFEEAVFRLGLLSVLALLLCRLAQAIGIAPQIGVVIAIVASALMFSGFHHVGGGAEPFSTNVFVFRAVAGLILGTMFVLRGFAVCVYAHAVYDVHYYLAGS